MPTEGVAQAKAYAEKLHIEFTYSTNGKEIYQISMKTGREGIVEKFPTPEESWTRIYSDRDEWKERFFSIPLEGEKGKRYYQEIAVNNAMQAIAEEKNRILLTLATGTGKTAIAFQVSWKSQKDLMKINCLYCLI
jgi:type I restriction enzyme, R subunit